MMQNPWKSPSAQLVLGGTRVARLAEQLGAIDNCLRVLLSLPASADSPRRGPSPRARLEAACVRIALALDVIWDDYADQVRRSMVDSVGPVGSMGTLSGIAAYVDLGEQALGALRRARDGGRSLVHGSSGFSPRLIWSRHTYANAVAWAQHNLTGALANDIATHALQELVRLSGPQVLTPQQVKERRARASARAAIFDSEWRLRADAAAVLELLSAPPAYAKYSDIVADVTFRDRKLKRILAQLCTLDLARNKARSGYCITERGARALRFRAR